MNKTLKLLLSLFIGLTFTGCTSNDSSTEVKGTTTTCVVYFSAQGHTEVIAKYIQEIENCDIYEIEPSDAYTDEDLDYNSDCRANSEQEDSTARPEIKNKFDFSQYEVIYIGYPIWWTDVPKIIMTLLDTYDLSGKELIPFCTSGGSDIDKSVKTLKTNYPKLTFMVGKRFSQSTTKEDVESFINEYKD